MEVLNSPYKRKIISLTIIIIIQPGFGIEAKSIQLFELHYTKLEYI